MARHSQAQGNPRIVAMGLAYYAQRETNLAWPGDAELQEWARVSKSQLYRALRHLEAAREIVRQPRLPGGPRRVYLVDPQGARQLPLFEANVSGVTPSRLSGERVTEVAERSPTRARGRNRQNQQNNTPPNPPVPGGDAPDLIPILGHHHSAPGAVQGAAAARRRRRRRDEDRACVASEPCPLQHPGDPGTVHSEAWRAFSEQLARAVGRHHWDVWFDGVHSHDRDGLTVIALDPNRVTWVSSRFGSLIASHASGPVALVGCEALGEAMR